MNISNINNTNMTPSTEIKPTKDRKSDAEFEGELLEAGFGALPQTTPAAQPGIVIQKQAVNENQEKGEQTKSSPKVVEIRSNANGGVDRSVLNQKTAASLNTGAAIAGLKPWSKDWVFEGRSDGAGKAIQPVLSGGESELNPMAELAEQLEQMVAAAGAAKAGANASGKAEQGQGGQKAVKASSPQPAAITRGGEGVMNAVDPALMNAAQISGMSQFKEMNGSLDMAEGEGSSMPVQKGDLKMARPSAAGGTAALSGSEFLSTLSAVQKEKSGEDRSNGEQTMNRDLGSRPELKSISGGLKGKGKRENFGEALGAHAGIEAFNRKPLQTVDHSMKTMTGHVTQGAATRERLSSETLLGISSGIRDLKALGGGEIKIRLKPENLGELHLRVITQGNNVGLQIQATDERAKKIIEETMRSLKDSLAGQNLNLAKVELSVASAQQASAGDLNNRNPEQGQAQAQQSYQDMLGQHAGQGSFQGGSQRWDAVDQDQVQGRSSYGTRPMTAAGLDVASAPRGRSTSANGRIDLMA